MGKTNQFRFIVLLLLITLMYVLFHLFNKKNSSTNYTKLINKKSSCISCHTPIQGFSDAHSPDKTTCISCHLGDAASSTKEQAHKTMVSVPGNLSNASKTCAKCHLGIDTRVKNSMMNTMSGIISVDKYVFGENDNLDSLFTIHHLKNNTSAEKHLRNKCASCHIGNEKAHPNPISQLSRGGGCTACHLNYSDDGKVAHQQKDFTKYHPSLSLKITDNHCFGCHSRSGRIATNYLGWHETVFKDTLQNNPNYWTLDDRRIFEKKQADIHHTKGLSCIDCHDANEVMGDGNLYAHQEDAVTVQCIDCHFLSEVKTVGFSELSASEQRIVRLRKMDKNHQFVTVNESKKVLLNVIKENNTAFLITKNTHQKIPLSKPAKNCTKSVHKNVSCSTCHTNWAPQCISCHTSFDANEDGYDLLSKKWKMGNWLEKGSDYLAEYPTLGVQEKNGKKTIKTFAPGMIMHLKKDNKNTNFHRLFAPVSAHTISSKGKTCTECHNNPVVLGYGRGDLRFEKGDWSFTPKYPLEKDGLPKDAWGAFFKEPIAAIATRKNTRPFSLKEQRKILEVGSCFTCHKETSSIANAMLSNYKETLKKRSVQCVISSY